MVLRPRYAHLQRLRRIANTLAKHGFGYFIDQLGFSGLLNRGAAGERPQLSRGERLRLALEELGPTFVKLGQFLSTRPDIVPRDIVHELSRLQDRVAPFDTERVYEILRDELGEGWEEIFVSFDPQPLAAASIGQVHLASLPGGKKVIVKVQRPEVARIIHTDLEILHYVAQVAQRHSVYGQIYDFVAMAEEFSRALKQELDYTAEGRNADRLRQVLAGEEGVYVPRVYWEYTTGRVLTMEFVEAVKLNEVEEITRRGYNTKRIANNLLRAFYRQVLVEGFFHGDPHPGNLAVLPEEKIVLMDFGLVGTLSEEYRREIIRLVLGLVRRRSQDVIRGMVNLGTVPADLDLKALRREIDNLRQQYLTVPLKDIKLGPAIDELIDVAFRFRIRMPAEFTLLAKALLSLESLITTLDPDLSFIQLSTPYVWDLVRRQYRPREMWRRVEENLGAYLDLAYELPWQVQRILSRLSRGDLTFKLEHQDLRSFFRHLEAAVNKLSLSLILLAFSIIMAGLIISAGLGALPLTGSRFFFRLPVLEIGSVIALVLFGWLLLTIFRGGRF
ncbi:AarF/ABC1/UbiB kinase family protein [Moorellaceae bacterium AZ2]